MELTREHFRAIISYNFRRGLLRQVAPFYSTAKNGYNEVNYGRLSLKYEEMLKDASIARYVT